MMRSSSAGMPALISDGGIGAFVSRLSKIVATVGPWNGSWPAAIS